MVYKRYIKRIGDIIGTLAIFVMISPVFLGISLVLLLQNKGKVFFYQQRIGYKEKVFEIIKFKTMTDEKDQEGNLLPDMERLTRFGEWIRHLSLDELPQLINVLKGEMSLIGPRPLLPKYLPLYSKRQHHRHDVKPGITGWAQVNGRNSISWTQKFEHDLYYVKHQSFLLDLKIVGLTILKVLQREGVNQSEIRPMQPFDGDN
ncbi:lipid carrier--UDP-N-acetylgalactosaminyltransferase [Aliifodinibius salipaludis]|uniref:Lipid carrier--UDP-N-acetylgalactosaminyltransferase n=2 Tax=Fodinibius salipaludis TaxID=2032627 RepID=A0A2A2GB41_9BACT|nr:lipid carrier--UDP-N-acetylgalactosaminyltransferase [Aliifodinibius salipaludis]